MAKKAKLQENTIAEEMLAGLQQFARELKQLPASEAKAKCRYRTVEQLDAIMSTPGEPDQRLTLLELRKLAPAERDAILSAAAAEAEEVYLSDEQLTDFEAFGEDDLFV